MSKPWSCRIGWLVGTRLEQEGTVGKDTLPWPPGIQRNPQEAKWGFSCGKQSSDTQTPAAGVALGKEQGCNVTLGNYTVNGAALMRK